MRRYFLILQQQDPKKGIKSANIKINELKLRTIKATHWRV